MQTPCTIYAHCPLPDFDGYAHSSKNAQERLQVVGNNVQQVQLTTGRGRGDNVGACFNPVRNDPVSAHPGRYVDCNDKFRPLYTGACG